MGDEQYILVWTLLCTILTGVYIIMIVADIIFKNFWDADLLKRISATVAIIIMWALWYLF